MRRTQENPVGGVLLCATTAGAVVEFALSRSLLPAPIAEYQTQLPKQLPAFPGGALAHFVGAYPEAATSTRLQGLDTVFLSFNQDHDGGAGT